MQNRDISLTFLKGIAVLRAYGDTDTDLTQAELAKRTGYDRATVRRLCLTLVEAGFATQSDRGFRLSPRVLTLAGNFLRANEIGYTVQPVLNEQARRLGSEIALAVRDGDRVLYVAQSHGTEARISFGLTVGSTLPLWPTATGRMLLAGLPEVERAALVAAAPLERHTPETCLDRAALRNRIAVAEADRVAVVLGEYETGVAAIAVPVGRAGRAVLGTTLTMPGPDFAKRRDAAVAGLRATAGMLGGLKALDHW